MIVRSGCGLQCLAPPNLCLSSSEIGQFWDLSSAPLTLCPTPLALQCTAYTYAACQLHRHIATIPSLGSIKWKRAKLSGVMSSKFLTYKWMVHLQHCVTCQLNGCHLPIEDTSREEGYGSMHHVATDDESIGEVSTYNRCFFCNFQSTKSGWNRYICQPPLTAVGDTLSGEHSQSHQTSPPPPQPPAKYVGVHYLE